METFQQENLGFIINYAIYKSSSHSMPPFQRYKFDWQHLDAKPGDLHFDTPTGEPLVLEVYPEVGDPWVGIFCSGSSGISGVFGTPSPDAVCVVCKGQGYWVPVSQPDKFQAIQSSPVLHIFAIPSCNLIGFGDFTGIEAYGPLGRLWMTERLSWDGLEIIETNENGIRGKAWDSPADKHVEFLVNPQDGTHIGGSSPESYASARRDNSDRTL